MELQNNRTAFETLVTDIVAIAQEEADPSTLSRVESFVGDGVTVVADPGNNTNETIARYGVYIVDAEGVVRRYLKGTKTARPRLDVILRELAAVVGKPVPEFARGGARTIDAAAEKGDAVDVAWLFSHDKVRPGDELKLALLPRIAEGYHVYAQSEARMVAFGVTVEAPDGLRLRGPIGYPKGAELVDDTLDATFRVYTGDVPISALEFVAADDLAPGNHEIRVKLRFQACDDRACYPPAEKVLVFSIEGAARDAKRGQVFGWQRW